MMHLRWAFVIALLYVAAMAVSAYSQPYWTRSQPIPKRYWVPPRIAPCGNGSNLPLPYCTRR